MAPTRASVTSSGISRRTVQPNARFSVSNAPFKFDKELLSRRSAKIAALLENNPIEDLTSFFQRTKADSETLELVARFCHGFEVDMTSDNIIPLVCISHQLRMTESHSPNNLLDKALLFLERSIFPSWDETIKSLCSSSPLVLEQAIEIGLFNNYLSTITAHASGNPSLLLSPSAIIEPDIKPINARRKLFGADHSTDIDAPSEDLCSLPLRVYEPVIIVLGKHQIPQNYILASLFQYLRKHQSDREVIEAVERLLPSDNYITTPRLLEMYSMSVSLGASPECMTGLEIRVGKQLDKVSLKDLLILDLGVENLRQILKGFYGNYNDSSNTGLIAVSELMEKYLMEIAKETDLETTTFTEVAEMVTSTFSVGSYRCTDAIYRAVDIYLENHKEVTEAEKEEVCGVLEFNKMSKQACEHAAQNQKLPLRVVVQALFVSQLQLRDDISKAVGQSCDDSNVDEGDDHGDNRAVEGEEWGDEGRELIEGCRHERTCCGKSNGKKKGSLWKEMKRKFGCMSSNNTYETLHDCNCHVKKRKKVHPKKN